MAGAGGDVLVRDFAEGDAAPANALTNRVIRESAIHFAYIEADDAEFRAAWERGRERHPWLAAEVEGRFAGFAKAGTWRERDAYRFTAETTVYVEEWARGRGVGRALMVDLLARLRAARFHIAVAGVALPNDASVALHERLGFERVGVFPAVGWKFERWWDVGFWVLRLEEGSAAGKRLTAKGA